MTSKQIEREIATLENGGSLSVGAAKRLRQLKQALPNVRAEESKRKETREKLKAYGDTTPATTSQPIDKGLEGAAWATFFARYCDPKGLSRIPKESEPVVRKEREPKVSTPFLSLNSRAVVLTVDIPANKVLRVGPAVIEKAFVTKPVSRKEAREWEKRRESGRRESSTCLPGWTFGLAKALEFIQAQDEGRLVKTYGDKRAARLERKLPGIRQAVALAQSA